MARKPKDLTPKSATKVKGGSKYAGNDNLTLLRGATPPKKLDLPPRKDVKGGKKKT